MNCRNERWYGNPYYAEQETLLMQQASNTNICIREFAVNDYDQVAGLWNEAELSPRVSDSLEEVLKKQERDPDLFLLACDGARVVGTVIGGWDGRRGWVYRLATHPEYQRRGVGRTLMTELENRLRAKGALSINILYYTDNEKAHAFYRSLGYKDRPDISVSGKQL